MTESVSEHVELTRAIDAWVRRLEPNNGELAAQVAVDLADILHAAGKARDELRKLMSADLTNPSSADVAMQHAANLDVQLFSELQDHLTSLQAHWPRILDALERSSGSLS